MAIDYAIIAPSNLARFAPSLPLMDLPFVFHDLDHWNALLSSNVLKPLEDELLENANLMVMTQKSWHHHEQTAFQPEHKANEPAQIMEVT